MSGVDKISSEYSRLNKKVEQLSGMISGMDKELRKMKKRKERSVIEVSSARQGSSGTDHTGSTSQLEMYNYQFKYLDEPGTPMQRFTDPKLETRKGSDNMYSFYYPDQKSGRSVKHSDLKRDDLRGSGKKERSKE